MLHMVPVYCCLQLLGLLPSPKLYSLEPPKPLSRDDVAWRSEESRGTRRLKFPSDNLLHFTL